ncbi:hypothetical protein TA3x_001908 [Tundrisphaera sp. TA3]|uniref:hypothetical protein n=1 Tax=Tundrisphaera sp. TA3 TaxID=3435775 RepID=UPI003EC14F8B
MRAPARCLLPASVAFASLLLVIGCDPPKKAKKAEDRGILGKKTQDIRDAPTEAAKGGVETTPSIPVTDPITQSTKGLIFALERTSQLQVEHALNLYQAEKGEYPKDTEQFMAEVIKPNNIALPVLPYYKKYAYLPDEHRLVIMEYPELKKAGPPQ